jgi:hypothetical protein
VRLIVVVAAILAAGVAASGAAARFVVEPGQPTVEPESPWALPIAFTAWGFEDGLFTARDLADRLVGAGIRSVAIQVDRRGPRATRSEAEVLDRAGLAVYLWGIPDDGDHRAAMRDFAGIADGYIAQVEDDEQYAALVHGLAAGVGEGLPRAVVTTFEGVNTTRNGLLRTPERMEPLAAAGIDTVFVECYRQDHPSHGDLALMLWQARAYGWSHAVPVVGLFRGDRLHDYAALDGLGPFWGFWNAEQIHPDDWRLLAARAAAERAA